MQMRILATCVNTISPQVQVESTLLLWLWRSDMFLAAIAYKVCFMTLVMSGHCRDVWSPWQTSWQSHSVTWMRIGIFKVHTASSFGRLCYSRLSSSSDIRSFREVLNRDRAQGRPATSLTLSSQLWLQPPLESSRQGKTEPIGQRSGCFGLKESEMSMKWFRSDILWN